MDDDHSVALADAYKNPLSIAGMGAADILKGGANQNATTPEGGTEGTNNDPNVLRYPLQRLDSTADYLSLTMFDYEGSKDIYGLTDASGQTLKDLLAGLGGKADEIEKIEGGSEAEKKLLTNMVQIYLPMPQNISDTMSVGYAEDTLNPLQVAGLKAANALQEELSKAGAKQRPFGAQDVNKVFADLEGLGVGPNEIRALRDGLSGVAINQLGANVNPQSIITRASGQILQSNLELLFNNVTLRSFPFAFDFAPRNRDESIMVSKIIRAIKQGMSPRKGESPAIFIKSPKLFKLRYMSGANRHPFLHKMKTGVITDMAVNYTGSNTYATYDDGTPVHMTMQFTFKEINPIYADDYEVETINDNEPLAPGGGVGY